MKKSKTKTIITKDSLSTGDAATLCSVTPDTVLKWIRSGRLTARKTPGGHHRIDRSALTQFLKRKPDPVGQVAGGPAVTYCWEFHSKNGVMPKSCRDCIVPKSGTRRCYELNTLDREHGYVGAFCGQSCEECDYYAAVQGQKPSVLVVTGHPQFGEVLKSKHSEELFKLTVVDGGYRCSMYIEKLRPDYIVIDCSMGMDRAKELAHNIYDDPRIPFVRVIVVGSCTELPEECNKLVYAIVDGALTVETLTGLIAGPVKAIDSKE